MSDRGATNPLFNSHLNALRSDLLPVVHQNWDTLADNVKDGMTDMCNYFCKMHLLVNFAPEANSTLKLFEDAVAEGSNPNAFTKQGESGAARLIRTACTAFTDHGSEKSGAPHYFNSHLSHHHGEDTNCMVTFRGNRFNILFNNAAAVYHHHKQIISFVASWPNPNGLLKAVKADAAQKVYLAGVRALGIVDKTITGPFFRLLGIENGVLKMNTHLHQMQLGLERWSKDASTLLGGEPLFSETLVKRNKDVLFQSLFAPSEDDELDVLTQQALEVVCASMLILLERQAEEQLPGGKFWQPTEAEKQKSHHVPTTNVVSERDFAVLDNLLRAKPYASSTACEAYIMWLNNQTSTWLHNLNADEKERIMDYARTHAASAREKFKEKKQEQRSNVCRLCCRNKRRKKTK
ncbi:Hypp6877 [Branchiostoma lanceolatum]|uniref:Hypp6877 protein n=1 Tax=Branchiostoma lanceolatum TaxID=7740 RepID=A0A8J9YVR0_BRALA|nr:Hypp6877 [Branchiostoma lanceolatum]